MRAFWKKPHKHTYDSDVRINHYGPHIAVLLCRCGVGKVFSDAGY